MSPQGRLIYIVDDDEAVRDSASILLLSHGMDSEAFSSARQFLAAFDPARAGCLLLDLHMPEMSGLELLEVLRARGTLLPIIVVSGRRDAALDLALRHAGAMAILSKPVDETELLPLIHKALGDE